MCVCVCVCVCVDGGGRPVNEQNITQATLRLAFPLPSTLRPQKEINRLFVPSSVMPIPRSTSELRRNFTEITNPGTLLSTTPRNVMSMFNEDPLWPIQNL
jgi:hypothetical protein